jgi:hypothetical protein
VSEPTITRNGHDKIIRFSKPIQAGGSRVRSVCIHGYYKHDRDQGAVEIKEGDDDHRTAQS